MTDFPPVTYDTIAQAEAVIIAAGYVRDAGKHVWVKGNKSCKVIRTVIREFIVQEA